MIEEANFPSGHADPKRHHRPIYPSAVRLVNLRNRGNRYYAENSGVNKIRGGRGDKVKDGSHPGRVIRVYSKTGAERSCCS